MRWLECSAATTTTTSIIPTCIVRALVTFGALVLACAVLVFSESSDYHHHHHHHHENALDRRSNNDIVDRNHDDDHLVDGEYRRVGPDDDEIHDEEILKAVQRSLYEFYYNKMVRENRSSSRVKRGIKMVCYGILGCFRDEGVFDYLDMVPAPPDEINTKFMIYTRRSKEPEIYDFDNYTNTAGSKFNASMPTKIIVHGFGSTCNRMWASEMRQALLAVLDCNVICVDWEAGAALPNYVRAAVNTRLVGKQLSLLVNWLNSNHGSRNEDFHLIGFSLGAHVAGFSGSELKNLSRITGLDPAGPLFESYDTKVRLDAGDATFVDVIHSNGDSLLMGGLGSWETIGHLDFYPNGGRAQKGCSHLFLGAFRDLIWSPSSSSSSSSSPASPSTSQPPLPLTPQSTTLPPSPSSNPPVFHGKPVLHPHHHPHHHHHKKMRMRMLPMGGDSGLGGPPPPPPPQTTQPPETDGRSLCNHRRAYKFFTESVSPRCTFPAFFCDSFDKYLTGVCFHGMSGGSAVPTYNMGYYADVGWKPGSPPVLDKNRLMYLATRDEEPFCANQYRIRVESSPSPAPISTYGGLEAIVIGGSGDVIEQRTIDMVNETFLVTQTPKDNMIAGSVLQRLIVAHPALTNPVKINLKYTAYQGWLYSGISRWSMDRIIITDARGGSSSFCTRGLLLPSGISVTVTLTPGICTNHPSPPLAPPPPNYPNYPYDTYTKGHNEQHPQQQHRPSRIHNADSQSPGQPSLSNLSKLISANGSAVLDYSDWQPIVNVSSEVGSSSSASSENATSSAQVQESSTDLEQNPHPSLVYVSKQVLPHDIDNILSEYEVTGPSEQRNMPTRLLLGTTRSLKSRPIVLRNRVREGRTLMGDRRYVFLVPTRLRSPKKLASAGAPSSSSTNEYAMRQVGMKMMANSGQEDVPGDGATELGDVVNLPGVVTRRGSNNNKLISQHHPNYHHHHHNHNHHYNVHNNNNNHHHTLHHLSHHHHVNAHGLVALRRRKHKKRNKSVPPVL